MRSYTIFLILKCAFIKMLLVLILHFGQLFPLDNLVLLFNLMYLLNVSSVLPLLVLVL